LFARTLPALFTRISSFPHSLIGASIMAEYGSANDPEQFKAIISYSPSQKVKAGTCYPAMIMMSADSDDRVDPMHARKFTAAIQYATNKRPVLFRLETNAGRGGGDMVKKQVAATVDEFSFLMQQLGMRSK
ncbi:MAG: prolyl oligopeptidase family serine peptidase, partial [Nitrospinaceae bacterium]|nr:prolyl oligopeptidase family serine peptidase [Nitrospinaceae bacterium]